MPAREALARWLKAYPDDPPVGWMLRERQSQIWTRFHNLPDAQRYPDTDAELDVVTDRLNRLAAHLFGQGEVGVFFMSYSEAEKVVASVQLPGCVPVLPIPTQWLSAMAPYYENPAAGTFLVSTVKWRPGLLEGLFVAAALDRVAGPTLLGAETGDLFCPYDGGVDLFVAEPNRRREIRLQFRDWLPEGATGYLSELDAVPVRSPLYTSDEWQALAAKLGLAKVEPHEPVN